MSPLAYTNCSKRQTTYCLPIVQVLANDKQRIIGLQYAQALIDTAISSGNLETISSDINTLNLWIKETDGLCNVLTNPLISADKKASIVKQISAEGFFNELTTNFLNVLIDRERIDCIVEVIEAFDDFYCKANDTQVAVIKSAVALEEDQQFVIAKKIQELTKSKSVKIRPVVDEAIIGGFVVEYGSNQIALSIRGAIERVKKELKTTPA